MLSPDAAPPASSISGGNVENTTTQTAPRKYYPTFVYTSSGGPRFDYDPVTHTPRGITIEGLDQNQIQNPQELSAAGYIKTGLTVTSDQIASPDGSVSADLVTASATPATIRVSCSANSNPYSQSVFAKKGATDWIYCQAEVVGDAVIPRVWFNLATGAIGTTDPLVTPRMIELPNGWYRCEVTRRGHPNSGTKYWLWGLSDTDNSTAVTVGKTAYLWGAQMEQGKAGMGSYFPNAVVLNQRNQDLFTIEGTNFQNFYNNTEGTFIVEFDVIQVEQTYIQPIVVVHDAAAQNYMRMQLDLAPNSNILKVLVSPVGGTNNGAALTLPGTIQPNTPYRAGFAYKLNDFAACVNGGVVVKDTAGNVPTAMNTFRLGCETVGWDFQGHIRSLKYFNGRKSDAELQALTVIPPITITSPIAVSVPERTTVAMTLTANSANGVAYWSLLGTPDKGRFSINSTTGVLSFVVPPNFEKPVDADGNNVYAIQVRATNGFAVDIKDVNITVTDVSPETPPTSLTLSNATILSNAVGGAYVGTLAACGRHRALHLLQGRRRRRLPHNRQQRHRHAGNGSAGGPVVVDSSGDRR